MATIPAPLIKRMSLDMLWRRIVAQPYWAAANEVEIETRLMEIVSEAGNVWDFLTETDARDGPPCKYGTANRDSMTYKLRKAAGFTNP